VVIRLLGFISTIVLARLLSPADFGIVALATSITGVIAIFGEFGFDIALIQKRQATRSHYDTVWTLTILRNLVVAAVLIAAAVPIARAYNASSLTLVLFALAVLTMLEGLQNVGVVDFRKNLDFRREFWFNLIPRIAGIATVIPAAFALRNFWALLAGLTAQRLTMVLASYALHPYRPRISLATVKELIRFSSWLVGSNVIRFVLDRLPVFVIGRGGNLGQVGTYDVAKEIAELPTTELIFPISRAVFPGLASLAADREALRSTVIDILGLIVCLGLPVCLGIALTSDLLVPILLGQAWLGAIQYVTILAVAAALTLGFANAGGLLVAIGRPDLTLKLNIAQLTVMLVAIAILLPTYGAIGVAWAVVAATAARLIINHLVLARVIALATGAVAAAIWRPVLAAGAMALAVIALPEGNVASLLSALVELATRVATGAATYIAVLALLWLASGRPNGSEGQILAWGAERLRSQKLVSNGESSGH
jgi:O-antigen/teichoic acid export membrane protein